MAALVMNDCSKFPSPLVKEPQPAVELPHFEDAQLEEVLRWGEGVTLQARKLIAEATQYSVRLADFAAAHEAAQKEFRFVPSQGRFVRASGIGERDMLASLQHELEMLRGILNREMKRAQRLEQRAMLLCTGHMVWLNACRADNGRVGTTPSIPSSCGPSTRSQFGLLSWRRSSS